MGVSDTEQGILFCLPVGSSSVTAGQLREVVQKYFRQNPEQLHLNADILVTRAFKSNWPCKRKADDSGNAYTPAPPRPTAKPKPKPEEDVKLIEVGSGVSVMSMFIRGGQSFETKAPLGAYRVKYATGVTWWYGDQHLFGPTTQYSEADKTFEFSRVGNQISGFTVELIRQQAGNLHTKRSQAGQF